MLSAISWPSSPRVGYVDVLLSAGHGSWILIECQAVLDGAPVDVREKGFNIFWPVSGFIVEEKRVFPHVHHQNRGKSGNIADFM